MTIKTPYKSEVIEEIKIDTSVIDGKVDIVDTSLDTLLSRLTASRANYLDNINNSNLATLPAISSARIGYLDNINNPQLLNISSTILGRIDASISSRSSHSASDIWSVGTRALTDKANFSLSTTGIDAIRKSVCLTGDTASSIGKILFDLNARLTSTRAGYLDNLSGGAVALNSTVAKEATLTHATYGLDKIKTETASLVSKVDTIDSIVDLIKIETDKIANATYGLSALNTDLDTLISNLGTVDTVVDAIKAKTDLLFSGIATEAKQNTIIGYIDTEIGAIKAKTDLIGASVAPADEYDTEMARITGNVALEATLTAIKGTGWTTETLKAIYDSIGGLNNITAASVWSVGTRSLTDKANFTLSTTGIDNIRKSVCLTGDTANSIGKILYDFSNVRLSATRCGYIDLLVNATYGLNAIKTAINAIPTTAMRGTDNAALASVWTSTRAGYIDYLADGTYGLSALKTLIDTVDTVCDNIYGKVDTEIAVIDAYFDVPTANATTDATIRDVVGRKTDTANTTVGTTSSLMRYTKGILGLLTNATYGLSALETLVDDLEGRLTATRAGYLDYLANGTYGLQAIKTQTGEIYSFLSGYLNQAVKTTSSPTFAGLTLSQATGTPPLTISSTTVCTNLNADMLDGYHSSSFFNTIYYILSDNLCLMNDTERSKSVTSYTKLKEITLQSGLQTTIRTYFELRKSGGGVGPAAFGQIYKNGVAFGTIHSTSSTTYQVFTEDLDFSDGTLYQVYGRGGQSGVYAWIRNQRILGTITVITAQITEGY